jgi:hypothetical protein
MQDPEVLAGNYVDSVMLIAALDFLKEQYWLQEQEDLKNQTETSYERFIGSLLRDELKSLVFHHDILIEAGPDKFKKFKDKYNNSINKTFSVVQSLTSAEKKAFLIKTLKLMKACYIEEEDRQLDHDPLLGHRGLRLYRSFDGIDELFRLDYLVDREMKVDPDNEERLYEGAGVGVQSGYSSILLAFEKLRLKQGARIVDLGSGYGRVGLVYSLLRPDIEFIGYEYVPHRVQMTNRASEELGLNEYLNFITQDLSLHSFRIPEADVYYLYDPFSEETYHYVLDQLVCISERRPVTIITKGNARDWLLKVANKQGWPPPTMVDEGNLCLFNTST